MANRVTGLDQEAVMDCFISGLQKDLQREVISQKSSSLIQAVSIACLFEDKFNPTKPSTSPIISNSKSLSTNTVTPKRSLSSQGSNTYSTSRNSLPPLLPTPTTKPTAFNPKSPNIKSISPAEMQLRREKGLCYYCDEKFSFKHRCPNKHLLLLQLEDAHPEEPDSEPPDITLNEPENAEPQHHLSLNAIRGASGVGTLRFTGHIAGLPIQILVDGGSSESFFQPRIAHLLHLPIESGPRFNVLVGNGQTMRVEGHISDLSVTIQGHELTVPVFLLPVVGADLIIGSPWLATLGPHVADYASLSLKFFLDGKFITLQGQKDASPTLAQLHHIRRFHHTKSISEVFTIQTIPPESSHALSLHLPPDMDPAMRQLLSKFSSVFQVPTRLPPQRDQDHAIPLVDESQVVKVKPYRYPHSQKEQIEKMVKDMLEQGIIQPSTSPFSSPIILVKKKDGTWRFCTDYRALNAITVKDSFPMPTVDELLDELHGVKFFSKLDLRLGYHQILMNPQDRHKTAFRTHHGHYEWLVMPFGLSNAPASFQCLMNKVFQYALRKFVLVFFMIF